MIPKKQRKERYFGFDFPYRMANKMLEDILSKAKKAADVAGKKTEDLVEISKLKLSAVQVNSDIKVLYEKLGTAVYSMQKANYENPELIQSVVEEIDEKRRDLKMIHDQLAVLKKTKACPCCQTKNPKEAYYCQKCGSKLSATGEKQEKKDNATSVDIE